MPREDAEKTIEQRVQELLQPLLAKIDHMEEIQGKMNAPMSADTDGAAAKSAKESARSDTTVDRMERIQGNRNAPMSADAGGAATKSALEPKRTVTSKNMTAQSKKMTISLVNHSNPDQEESQNKAKKIESDQKGGKRKKRRRRKTETDIRSSN